MAKEIAAENVGNRTVKKADKQAAIKTAPVKTVRVKPAKKSDPWKVILYPHMAEKSMSFVDTQNKVVFIVNRKSSKPEIKKAFEEIFEVKTAKISTEITQDGEKKACIKLDPKYSAADIATKLGIL